MEKETVKTVTQKAGAAITELQKLKLIFDVVKWLIGSVALVIVTMVIDYGFRDRAAGVEEVKQYDRYVTTLIVLNKEVGPRRLLAQYFSYVLPSEKMRKCWQDYYWVVNTEYQAMVKQDSILGSKLKWFMAMKSITAGDQIEVEALSKQKKYTEKELFGDFRLPPPK
ncbi:MAG: hypothetical protein NTY96_12725 [Bacteroidetes bacterium]|nr:hypothetical protein [Bacteroidota bacterium]